MKVLVYGAGVIGSLMIHELITAGNEVTVIARGQWKENLENNGLRITINNKKKYTDHPRILSAYDGQKYDVTFSIMQNQQQDSLLDTLAAIHTDYLVLVGNNMESARMHAYLQTKRTDHKTILFGFQTSGGQRYKDHVDAVTFGSLTLTIGHLNEALTKEEKTYFETLFSASEMKLEYEDNMESWYICHAAFIIPAACISYIHNCNLKTCTMRDVKDYIQAGSEAYDFLHAMGIPIRPKGDEKNLHGVRRGIITLAMWIVFKSKTGELAISNHCRNAVTEMQFMDDKFQELKKSNPSFPMPVYDSLRKERLDWSLLQQLYSGEKA